MSTMPASSQLSVEGTVQVLEAGPSIVPAPSDRLRDSATRSSMCPLPQTMSSLGTNGRGRGRDEDKRGRDAKRFHLGIMTAAEPGSQTHGAATMPQLP
jgi:hypothetical protein